ncbi:hypothetical protein GGR60_002015 [Xanthomonas arboricola]|uniref:hypothetical protein n=1 Tax=Xanthomonas euroxanthea TaxID=2259622 RepID=UPI001430599E|nr:hypothetical protein [Xanthomonas euroxanthea]NJC37480.1 hypothetical protein [Xanthomonas euroxanthea]
MKLGISEAFRRYGATLKNVNWSVSSWVDDGTLVVSLWDHHHIKGYQPGVLAFGDRFDRWSGLGNKELRTNVARAFDNRATVRLVLARTLEPDRVQRGEDGSKIPKTFAVRNDLVGRVADVSGENYVIEFRHVAA